MPPDSPPDPPAAASPRATRLPSAERQAQILDAAVEEFAGRGYAGARMAAVASRAGVTKGLLYHYFPGGKTDLFRVTIASCVAPLLAEAHGVADGFEGTARDLIGTLIDFGYARLEMEPREHILMRLLLTEADRFPELAELYRSEILQPALSLTERVLRIGIATGEFRAGVDAQPGLAHVLLAPVLMGSIWRMMLGGAAPPAGALRDAHLDMMLRALAA
jgi:AcrR family transcriptional regulator